MDRTALTLLSTLLAPALAAADYEPRNLSAGYRPGTVLEGIVRSTADGAWTLATFCEPVAPRWCWIAALPRDGGPPVELSGALWLEAFDSTGLALSPDGRRAVYHGRYAPDDPLRIWTRAVDGASPAIVLWSATSAEEAAFGPTFTPGGESVLFVHLSPGEPHRLRAAPAAGGGGRELDAGDVELPLAFSPSGSHAVYWNDTDDDGSYELRAVAIASGPAWTLDDIVAPPAADLDRPVVSPGGGRVVFATGLDEAATAEVWSVPLASSGARMRISDAHAAGTEVLDLAVAPAGRAVYRWRPGGDGPDRLSSAPIDGSAAPHAVGGAPVAGGGVVEVRLAGDQVVYRADAQVAERFELWSAPADGSAGRTRRSAPLPPDGDVHGFQLAPDGLRLVYRADGTVAGRVDLYSSTVAGFAAVQRLSNLEPFGDDYGALGYAIAADSRTLVYETHVDGTYDGRLRIQDLRDPTPFPEVLETGPERGPFTPLDAGAAVRFETRFDGDAREDVWLADRRFFADGFETGDASGWSASVP
jgi:hypothetical protein